MFISESYSLAMFSPIAGCVLSKTTLDQAEAFMVPRSLVSAAFFAQQLVSARWQRRKGHLMTCASQYSVKAGGIELSSNYSTLY